MDEKQLQQQIVQLVQLALQGDLKATQLIEQIMQAAQKGDQLAIQIALMIQQVAQQMLLQQQLQQVRAARFGAKLNYIKQLKGVCPEGYEIEYYEKGGRLYKGCKRCMKQNGGRVRPATVAEQFKMESAKCGKKMKKKACGGSMKLK